MNPDDVKIRAGTAADIPALLEIGALMHREVHYGSFAPAKRQAVIEACLQRGIVLVSLDDAGAIVGTVGLICEQPWWSEDWQLEDRWVFVHPDFRRTGHARALLRAARGAAVTVGLPLLIAHVGQRAKGKLRLFQREFGEPVGAVFFVAGPVQEG